jgi:rhodanese-related sulfurtransferase
MRGITVQRGVLVLAVAVAVLAIAGIAAAGTATITPEELKAKLGDPNLIIVDVRRAGHWEASDRKIAGAVREDPKDVEGWAGKYAQDKTLVLYCA